MMHGSVLPAYGRWKDMQVAAWIAKLGNREGALYVVLTPSKFYVDGQTNQT